LPGWQRVLDILFGVGASVLVIISFALFITGDLLCLDPVVESWPRNRGLSFVYWGGVLERDAKKWTPVFRKNPALNYENRSRFMILGRLDPKSS